MVLPSIMKFEELAIFIQLWFRIHYGPYVMVNLPKIVSCSTLTVLDISKRNYISKKILLIHIFYSVYQYPYGARSGELRIYKALLYGGWRSH